MIHKMLIKRKMNRNKMIRILQMKIIILMIPKSHSLKERKIINHILIINHHINMGMEEVVVLEDHHMEDSIGIMVLLQAAITEMDHHQ